MAEIRPGEEIPNQLIRVSYRIPPFISEERIKAIDDYYKSQENEDTLKDLKMLQYYLNEQDKDICCRSLAWQILENAIKEIERKDNG